MLLLLTEASLESKEAGPLTDELYTQGFSAVTVPIGPGVILAIVILLLFLAVHEGFVAAGALGPSRFLQITRSPTAYRCNVPLRQIGFS